MPSLSSIYCTEDTEMFSRRKTCLNKEIYYNQSGLNNRFPHILSWHEFESSYVKKSACECYCVRESMSSNILGLKNMYLLKIPLSQRKATVQKHLSYYYDTKCDKDCQKRCTSPWGSKASQMKS